MLWRGAGWRGQLGGRGLRPRDSATVKVREVVAVLESNGFASDRQKGSHHHFEGVVGGKRRLVTVPGKAGDEVPKGSLASIRRQSGLSRALFR